MKRLTAIVVALIIIVTQVGCYSNKKPEEIIKDSVPVVINNNEEEDSIEENSEVFSSIVTSSKIPKQYPAHIVPVYKLNTIDLCTQEGSICTISYESKEPILNMINYYATILEESNHYQITDYLGTTWIYGQIQDYFIDVIISKNENNNTAVYISTNKINN